MHIRKTLKEFERHLMALNRAESTTQWYLFLLERFLTFAAVQGVRDVPTIDRRLMLSYQQHVSQITNRHGRCYAIPVQNLHVIVVRLLFRHLERTGQASGDPTSNMQLARVPDRLPAPIPSVEEMARILEQPDLGTIRGIRDRAMMELLYSTGMRRSELLDLDLPDVCMDTRSAFIRKGKGAKSRVVPFGTLAAVHLQMYLDVRDQFRPELTGTQAVFLSVRGKRLDKQSLRRIVARYAMEAGIAKAVTPHSFRHCCASHLLANGASVVHIQQLLGHAKLETTMRYLRVSIPQLKSAHAKYHPREKGAWKSGWH